MDSRIGKLTVSCTQKKVAGTELPLSMAAGTLQLLVEPWQGMTGALNDLQRSLLTSTIL